MTDDDDKVATANATQCIDCDEIYEGAEECPEDPERHGYIPVFISAVALGRPDDQDSFHHGRRDWVYDAEDNFDD